MKKKLILCLWALSFCLSATAVYAQGTPNQGEIRIDGSTTVGPVVDAFVSAFNVTHPNIRFSVKKTGSGDGATALVEGRCDVAAMSRFMRMDEYTRALTAGKMLVPFAICLDSVCLIVHPNNPIRNLTQEQVKQIYKGEISNWQELGGPDMPIVAISRDTASGTYEVFHQLAMDSERLGAKVEFSNSNPAIFTRVSTTA